MKRVLLRYFSANNLGDDLFVKVVTERYEDQFTAFSNVSNPTLEAIDNLRIIRRPKVYYLLHKVLARFTGKRHAWLQSALTHNDLFLYVGGSIFQQEEPIDAWKREDLFYQQIRKPYYLLGSNIGPYRDGQDFLDILHRIFEHATDVCFRDTASYNLFEDLFTTRLASDVVLTMKTPELVLDDQGGAIVSVVDCYKRFGEKVGLAYERAVADLTAGLVAQGLRVKYISFWDTDGDTDVSNRIFKSLPERLKPGVEVVGYTGNIDEVVGLFARCSTVIATRFHAVILGLLFGKKVLPMAYSDKTLNILKDMDFQGPVIDIREIDQFDVATFDFDSIQVNNVDAQKALAEKQFQELDKVLEKRK